MQIVIDISEDVYTRLFDNGIQDNEILVDDVCEMAMAIRKGTPAEKSSKWMAPDVLNHLIGAEVLYKIRAEIVHLHDWAFSREEILRIIDKYMPESEGQR